MAWLPVVFMVFMVTSGFPWLPVVFHGYRWFSMVTTGFYGFHGYQWFSMVTSGFLCTAKMPVLNQPAVVLLARVDSQSAC